MSQEHGVNDEGESLHPDEVLARAIARRGDIFDQFKLLIRESAPTYDLISKTAGYVHHYVGQTGSSQQLSGVMRELIALSMLAAKAEHGFTPNHVRRLYNHGVTNAVMLEAATAMAAVTGWTTVAHTATAILTANTPDYPFGSMPPDGEPKVLQPFAELAQGREQDGSVSDDARDQEEYKFIAEIDPDLARVVARWVNHCLTPKADSRLGAGPRELLAIAAACARGEVDLAVQHIRRAYAYGMTPTQVLEAVSCVVPMTGSMTLKIGVRAMRAAAETAA
ncbi:carboxymuconolactone decarboxylase family protein [Hydrogenophaga sp.]|uniref:carboxymuconolactone decarboxylase family protein n=1 Tax=Hydrogenophaga sp. TaxID=1904254 RepID=UPI002718D72D|nr:carboxymuconolactone decarboxylase family protein [Hydrogenophaga sp.]MDO9435161.1 carboxymuconolactone decarboxylase family protein [Hydrogenophaga sp.]